jgi:hypothetical protein
MILGLILLLTLAGCATRQTGQVDLLAMEQGDYVNAIKRGTLPFDVGITIGDAFDHYGGFHTKFNRWEHFRTHNQRNIIEFSGMMDLSQTDLSDADIDRLEKVRFVTQFAANVDNTIEIRSMGFLLKAKGGEEKEYRVSSSNHNLYLKPIYANRKFSHTRYELIIQNLVLR